MSIVYLRAAAVLAAAVALAGCGKQERREAAAFAKAISGAKPSLAAADGMEKDLVASLNGWCATIAANGGGRGAALDQNAVVAGEMAKSAVATSARISEMRQAVEAAAITEEYPRGVRHTLLDQLTKRQRLLQDIRGLLDNAAAQFKEYGQSRAYKGDTYPDSIAKLDALLSSYRPPEDAAGAALSALQSKYNFAPNEI
jgi:hypothetical protein